jgi:hypothetical protein
MNNVEQPVISQYGNSPTISQLIQNMNEYIDPEVNIWAFYNFVFNVQTAQGFGLDIWGRIVGLQGGRNILANPVYVLDDTAFRSVILLKALSNISASTIPAINQLLTNWMTGRGKTWVIDNGNMQLTYIFDFALLPFELAILTQSGIFLRPAGVFANTFINDRPFFGFKAETGSNTYTGFNQAPFVTDGES